MQTKTKTLEVRRILVALDASSHSQSAMDAAAELAAGFQAELLGVFVEDVNLLRVAQLPSAREVLSGSAVSRALNTAILERALRVQGETMGRALASAAARRNVRCSFRVARGQIARELLRAAAEADMIVLGKAGRSPARRSPLGSIAMAVGTTSTRTVVLLEHGGSLRGRVVVLFDGTETGFRALATSARVAGENGGDLVVLIPSDDAETCRRLERNVEDWQRESNRSVRMLACAFGGGVSCLSRVIQQAGTGTLVLPVDHPVVQSTGLALLMEEVRWPVILVR